MFIPNPILAGAVAGYLGSGGDLKAAALGAVGGAIFHSIGSHFNEVIFGSAAHFQKTLAHGLAGGLLSQAGGGRFGDGFLGAAAGQLAAPAIDGIGRGANGQIATDPASRLARVVSAAAVGGTASTIGGGKFANGAISAGFARAMNDERHLRIRDRLKSYQDKVARLLGKADAYEMKVAFRGATGFTGGALAVATSFDLIESPEWLDPRITAMAEAFGGAQALQFSYAVAWGNSTGPIAVGAWAGLGGFAFGTGVNNLSGQYFSTRLADALCGMTGKC